MDYNTEFMNRFTKKQATLISELISGKLSAEVHLELTQEIHATLRAEYDSYLASQKDAVEVSPEDDLHPRNPPKKK